MFNPFQQMLMGLPGNPFGVIEDDKQQQGQPMQLTGAMQGAPQSATTADVAAPMLDQDRQTVAFDQLGQMGALLMAAGQRMTPYQRAQILSQGANIMGNTPTHMFNAAQARLMNTRAQAVKEEEARNEEIRKKAPALAASLGIPQELTNALSPEQIHELYIKKQMADPRESQLMDLKLQHEQAQINALNAPKAGPTPQLVDLPGGGKGWTTPGSNDVVPIAGAGKGSSEEPKKTEAEVKGYQFAQQSIDAYKKLADPEYQYALTSRAQQLANKIPYFRSPWSSNDYRSADAASSAMTDAILRNKSGATIHDPEIQDEIRRVIPQPGDTPEQLQDKVTRQRQMIDGFIGAANPADRKALREMFDKANNDLLSKYKIGKKSESGVSTTASRPIISGPNGHKLQLSADGKRWEDIGQ